MRNHTCKLKSPNIHKLKQNKGSSFSTRSFRTIPMPAFPALFASARSTKVSPLPYSLLHHISDPLSSSTDSLFQSITVSGPVARFARQIAGQGFIVAAPSSYHEFLGPEPLAYDGPGTDTGNEFKIKKVQQQKSSCSCFFNLYMLCVYQSQRDNYCNMVVMIVGEECCDNFCHNIIYSHWALTPHI